MSQLEEDRANISSDLNDADQVIAHLVFAGDAPLVKLRDVDTFFTDRLNEHSRNTQTAIAYNELMMWSVVMGYGPLSEIFWQEGGGPCPRHDSLLLLP